MRSVEVTSALEGYRPSQGAPSVRKDRLYLDMSEQRHQSQSKTVVAWTGEFGRTPKINKNAGRDHWGNVYSTVLAGGGIRGGQVYGASDKIAGEPADKPVHTTDFVTTIYHALGYAPGTMVYDIGGRPRPLVSGKCIRDIF